MRQWGASKDWRCHRRAKIPVREIPPVLAGIRAGELWIWPSHALTTQWHFKPKRR